MTDAQKEILIEGFLAGNLSDEDKSAIEFLVKNDAAFYKELMHSKNAMDLLRMERSRQIVADEFKKVTSQAPSHKWNKNRSRIFVMPAIWRVAAGILILGLVTWGSYYIFFNKQAAYEVVAKNYFTPYAVVDRIPTMGLDEGIIAKEREAYREYESEDFESCILKFESLLANAGDREPYIRFYLANAQLAVNRVADAKQNLLLVLKSNFPLLTQTKWYLALAFLLAEDKHNALPLINELTNDDQYGQKARNLKKEVYE